MCLGVAAGYGMSIVLNAHATYAQETKTPATQEEVNTYMQMGAVNLCILSTEKGINLSTENALKASAGMVSNVLANKHGNRVAGENDNQEIPESAIWNSSAALVALKANETCKLTGENKEYLERLLASIKELRTSN